MSARIVDALCISGTAVKQLRFCMFIFSTTFARPRRNQAQLLGGVNPDNVNL